MAADRLPDPGAICPGCKRPVNECQAEDVADPLFLAHDAVSPADTIRQALTDYLPDGFRDEDGVWHDGPVLQDALAALTALLAVGERDKAELDAIRRNAEQMIREGCTHPSPEAFAHLATLRERHVAQIKALEKKVEAGERDKAEIERLREPTDPTATLQDAAEFIEFSRAWVRRPEDATPRRLRAALEDALAFIERQAEWGERDRQHIRDLTEALRREIIERWVMAHPGALVMEAVIDRLVEKAMERAGEEDTP